MILSNLKFGVRHIHIPIQSGSDKILKRMNRKYNTESLLHCIQELHGISPAVEIRTDLIVGFPGETEEDFLKTLSFVRKANFYRPNIFSFCPAKGTPAARMKQAPKEAIRKRFARLVEEIYHDEPIRAFISKKKSDDEYEGNIITAMLSPSTVLVKSDVDIRGKEIDIVIESVSRKNSNIYAKIL